MRRCACGADLEGRRPQCRSCSGKCRAETSRVRLATRSSAVSVRFAARRLKPSALAVLGRLQAGPATNRDLMNLAGFGWACRVSECRAVGHEITCQALGPTRGMRTYTLETSAQEAGGRVVDSGKPLPAPDAPFEPEGFGAEAGTYRLTKEAFALTDAVIQLDMEVS